MQLPAARPGGHGTQSGRLDLGGAAGGVEGAWGLGTNVVGPCYGLQLGSLGAVQVELGGAAGGAGRSSCREAGGEGAEVLQALLSLNSQHLAAHAAPQELNSSIDWAAWEAEVLPAVLEVPSMTVRTCCLTMRMVLSPTSVAP